MIRHVLIGIFAAVVAIVVVAVAQPKEETSLSLGPRVVKIDDIETFLPKPGQPRRTPATRPADPLAKIVPEANFQQAPLSAVIDYLRDLTGANFLVDWRALEAAGIESRTPVTAQLRDVPAATVLSFALQSAGGGNVVLSYRHQDGIVHVSTAESITLETEIRLYNVRDLLVEAMRFHRSFDHAARAGSAEPPRTASNPTGGSAGISWQEGELAEQLRQLIRTVDPDTWIDNGGRTGACHYWAGKLLIVQTPENHDQIERFLNMLREE